MRARSSDLRVIGRKAAVNRGAADADAALQLAAPAEARLELGVDTVVGIRPIAEVVGLGDDRGDEAELVRLDIVEPADLRAAAARQARAGGPGDAVLVEVGWRERRVLRYRQAAERRAEPADVDAEAGPQLVLDAR